MGHARANLRLFSVFKNKQYIFITNKCIRCWDPNPQPLKQKSSPVTTRPGATTQQATYFICCCWWAIKSWLSTSIFDSKTRSKHWTDRNKWIELKWNSFKDDDEENWWPPVSFIFIETEEFRKLKDDLIVVLSGGARTFTRTKTVRIVMWPDFKDQKKCDQIWKEVKEVWPD